jgi:hypothetical protein
MLNNVEYNEIPGGSYYRESIGNPFAETSMPTKENKFIWIPKPMDGEYNIQVIGTDLGPYTLEFLTYNKSGEATEIKFEGVTNKEVISDYRINYNSIPEKPTIIERIVNIQDVIIEIEIGRQLNLIDNDGIKNSLIRKLNNAKKQIELSQKNTAINILNAFLNEVKAQKGEHINLNFAELLIKNAQYICGHL